MYVPCVVDRTGEEFVVRAKMGECMVSRAMITSEWKKVVHEAKMEVGDMAVFCFDEDVDGYYILLV